MEYLSSPYDLEAHYARKRSTQWVGYKIHVTEACEEGLPNLITDAASAPGPTADGAATPAIHAPMGSTCTARL